MSRHVFRMTYYQNVEQFLMDGAIFAKNHQPMQPCFQTSYQNIVNRRGQAQFATPCGGVVNDFVPFYFSPITSMAFTIHKGNVDLIDPEDGKNHGSADMNELVFVVCDPEKIAQANIPFWFTDIACNSAMQPGFENDLTKLKNHIDWELFDDDPMTAKIPEIGYSGVCRYFANKDDPPEWKDRSRKRMAEFMVKDAVPLNLVDCVVTQNETIKKAVETYMANSIWDIPVYAKPGCYF